MARQLFGCYRASDANDPETFIKAATAVLAGYPETVACDVCDPVRGLPSEDTWLPSIARIRVECDKRMQPIRDQERRDRVRAQTLAVRRASKAPIGSVEHRRVVKSFMELSEAMTIAFPKEATP